MKDKEYFILDYDDERVFESYDAAYDYDVDKNPEMHPHDDASHERAEDVIYSVGYDELSNEQKWRLNPYREEQDRNF